MTHMTESLWRWRWIPTVLLMLWVLVLVSWAFDRKPPFELYSYEASSPRAGETLEFVAHVRRDIPRDCSVSFSRHMFDSTGARLDIQASTLMTPQALSMLDKVTPDHLKLRVPIPAGAASGPAQFVTSLEYVCNPLHTIWPIRVQMQANFEVAP